MQVFVKNFLLRQHELITLRASTFGHVPGRRITSLQSNLWMGGLEKGLIRSQSSFDRNFALISLDWHACTIKTNIETYYFGLTYYAHWRICFYGVLPTKNIVSFVLS